VSTNTDLVSDIGGATTTTRGLDGLFVNIDKTSAPAGCKLMYRKTSHPAQRPRHLFGEELLWEVVIVRMPDA